MPHRARRRTTTTAAIGLAVAALGAGLLTAAPASAAGASAATAASAPGEAPGAPGAMSHFDLARKDCVGTARNRTSKVWFTVADGVLSDVYYPTIDNTNVETLQYVVTDGKTLHRPRRRATRRTASTRSTRRGMACRVTSTAKNGRYRLVTDYLTDPARASVVVRTTLLPASRKDKLDVYVRFDATVNGNGGGGDAATKNAGADTAVIDTSTKHPVPVSIDTNTATIAANRDYAQPVYAALRADRAFTKVSSGFAGTASDGLTQLDKRPQAQADLRDGDEGQRRPDRARSTRGRAGSFQLALGFGATQEGGRRHGRRQREHARSRGCTTPTPRAGRPTTAACTPPRRPRASATPSARSCAAPTCWPRTCSRPARTRPSPAPSWRASAARGARRSSAGDPALTYFGSYREVFARDLYETFTGLVAAGDIATAKDTVRFLFDQAAAA